MLKIMCRLLITIASAVLISGCVTTAAVVKNYPEGSTVEDQIIIDKRVIPLPPGKWEVFASREVQSSQGTPTNAMILANTEPGTRMIAIRLSANVAGANRGGNWAKLKACTRTDMHFSFDDKSLTNGEHACWFINHTRMTRFARANKMITEAFEKVIARGIKLPLTSVYAGFRVSNGLNLVTVRYYFNPEAEGFDPPRNAAWSTNDWHKDRVYTDPKKVAYIEKTQKWGEVWFSKVKAGFEGKLSKPRLTLTTK